MKETNLSSTIKLLRWESGMSQFELASKIGSSYSYISRLESGKVDPRWSTIEKIFRVLNKGLYLEGQWFNLIES